jgi:hypothetical protein
MAFVPLSGTNIRLLSGVPFSNDYKNTRWFDTQTAQENYFLSKNVVHSMTQANFQRIEGKHFIAVNKAIDDLWNTNYLMFKNQNNIQWWYAFVTKLEYKQANLTYVYFQIDVFQSWKFYMDFKPSFVVREHRPLWNEDGTPVINTVDEGLHYGSEYDNVSITQYKPLDGWKWLVISSKNPMHEGSNDNQVQTSIIGTPSPLSVYLLPFKDDGSVPQLVDSAGNGVVLTNPAKLLDCMYLLTNAVNNIVSIYITDYTGIPATISEDTITMSASSTGTNVIGAQIKDDTNFVNCLFVSKVDQFAPLIKDMGLKYDGYNAVKESKLLMYPYTQLILDDFKGNRASFKSEYILNSHLSILTKGSLGVSNKTSYGVSNYNYLVTNLQNTMSDESALINNEANDIPIITDLLSAYIQGNRNSLANQRSMIAWNGATDLAGSVVNGVANGGSPVGLAGAVVSGVQGVGNTILQIQGMQAKIKDISNVPPSLAKMGSNTSYTIGNGHDGVYIIKKQIKAEYIKKLEDFFGMFGYKTNEVKIPNFHTRENWNYVQTANCMITGNFNNEDLQELKAIFDNGITLWHTDDVGNYSLTNEVIA